jgi:F-type H+-transporting ATPase subunit b
MTIPTESTLVLMGAAEADAGLLGTLGIDWRLLIMQALGFLILVWFLKKFVFPHLIAAIDRREAAIAQSVEAAHDAEAKAEAAEAEVKKTLAAARKEAEDIVATAHKETVVMLDDAEKKAQKKADHIVKEAHEQIDKDIASARETLKSETKKLVAVATEKVVKEKVDGKRDEALIESALKEAR